MKRILYVLLFIILFQSINAQNSFKGTITDKSSNEVIANVAVYCTELNIGTRSNEQGQFELKNLSKGVFKMQFSLLGYQSLIETITVKDSALTLNISLNKNVFEVNEVVVSGAYTTSQDESPQEIDVVKINEMQKTGASTVMDVISKVPGVSAITTGPHVSRPVIRGMSGNRILTVVDGVRFETQQWDEEHGIGVNELGTDRIEIIKGPASLLYGPEAMGGVIHFVEEQPAAVGHTTAEVRSSAYTNNGSFGGGGKIKGATEKYNWCVSAQGKLLSDYFYDGYTTRVPNTRLTEGGGKATFGITRKWGSSTLSYTFNQAYYGILDIKDLLPGKKEVEKDMFPTEIEAPYHSVMDNKINSQTTILAGASRFKITLGYQNNQRTEFEDTVGRKTGYEYISMNLSTATYDLKWHLPTWKHFSTIIGTQGMYQTNTNDPKAYSQLVPDATISDMGFVALTKYNLKRFNLTAGVRWDSRNLSTVGHFRNDSTITINMPAITRSYDNISGAIGATYDIEDHLLLRANYAAGYRTPNLNELMSNGVKLESRHFEIGDINFVKETNNEFDLSAIIKSKNFSVEVGAYVNNIMNFIYLAPTGGYKANNLNGGKDSLPVYQFYQDNALIAGGEAGLDIHPQSISWVHLELKGANLSATRTGNNTNLPMMPADRIYSSLVFSFKEHKWFRNMWAKIGSMSAFDQNKVAPNETTTPGYTLLNLAFGATTKIWKLNTVEFVLAVNNALDTKYIDNMSRLRVPVLPTYPNGVYNQGINVVLSLRVPFNIK
jgi:iron complex outermembrane receptor protein